MNPSRDRSRAEAIDDLLNTARQAREREVANRAIAGWEKDAQLEEAASMPALVWAEVTGAIHDMRHLRNLQEAGDKRSRRQARGTVPVEPEWYTDAQTCDLRIRLRTPLLLKVELDPIDEDKIVEGWRLYAGHDSDGIMQRDILWMVNVVREQNVGCEEVLTAYKAQVHRSPPEAPPEPGEITMSGGDFDRYHTAVLAKRMEPWRQQDPALAQAYEDWRKSVTRPVQFMFPPYQLQPILCDMDRPVEYPDELYQEPLGVLMQARRELAVEGA